MDKPKVDRGILAQLASNVKSAKMLVIELNDEDYDGKHELMNKLGGLRSYGRAIERAAQQAIDELTEV